MRGAAHGGQILLSETARVAIGADLPAAIELTDLGRFALRDMPAPMRLWHVSGAGLSEELAPPRAAAAHELPAVPTSFIGRARELRELARATAQRPLVTLVGPGGCGKTRLALELARRLEGFDRLYLVELADVSDSAQVGQAIADRVGARAPDALAATLSDQRALLVLDNCEHVLDACTAILSA